MNRISELDGMRGVGVLMVMSFHFHFGIVRGGWLGVDVFFVLSGFLITSILLSEYQKTGRIDFKAFYLRRARRLIPALAVFLVCWSAISKFQHKPTLEPLLTVLFYVANFAQAFHWPEDLRDLVHLWSLSVEEQFYFLWPVLMVLMLRLKRPGSIPIMILSVMLAIGIWRALVFWQTGDVDRVYEGSDTRSDMLLAGCLIAFIPNLRSRRWLLLAWLPLLTYLAARMTISSPFNYFGGLSFAAASLALILHWVVKDQGGSLLAPLRWRPLVFTGQISYGLYLWHFGFAFTNIWPPQWWFGYRLLMNFAISFAIASLSYYLVERPCLQFKLSPRTPGHQPIGVPRAAS